MIVVNTMVNPKHLPNVGIFVIGTVKSSFEMTTAQRIATDILHQNKVGPLLRISHPIFAGGIAAINIAQSTNTLFYTFKAMVDQNNDASSLELLQKGSDYAFAYSLARSFYQVGQIMQDQSIMNQPLIGAACYFFAPIARGCFLSFSETGSVTVPGKKIDYFSNVLDGFAIATTSLARTHLDNDLRADHSIIKVYSPNLGVLIEYVGVGNGLTLPFLGIVGVLHAHDNTTVEL